MLPTPTKTDIPMCDADVQPCYLWIHLPYDTGRVITFPSIKQAYVFAENYVFDKNAYPLVDAASSDVIWTAADGVKWVSPTMTWDKTLSKIYDDIQNCNLSEDKQWLAITTTYHQMIIGLGSDIPEKCRLYTPPSGYTLEAHDAPEDMPQLLWMPEMELQEKAQEQTQEEQQEQMRLTMSPCIIC